MSDAITAASAALQTQVTAGLPGPAGSSAILALADALQAGAQTYALSVAARRIGILNSAVNEQVLLPMGSNIRVATIAAAWNEVFTANQFLARAKNLSGYVVPLRATDSTGAPSTALIANIPVATLNSWAAALIQAASDFEALELVTLPA